MARATKATTPGLAPAETAPADEFAGLTAYAADAWVAPLPPLSPTVLAFVASLKAEGKAAVVTEGWTSAKERLFRKQLKAALDGKVSFKAGTVNGKPGLRITIPQSRSATA